jgi:hypothetical protein
MRSGDILACLCCADYDTVSEISHIICEGTTLTSSSSEPVMSYRELAARQDRPPWSTWGMFGPDDELGMINLLGADKVLAGVRSVRRGAVFNLDLPLDAFDPHFSARRRAPTHTMFQGMPHHLDDYLDGFYLQGSSQIDSLRHIEHPEFGFYNGHADGEIRVGSPVLGINRWSEHGIVGRAVLLDVERHLAATGDPVNQSTGRAFGRDVLESTARAQGVEVRRGDMVLVRTGWLHHALHELTPEGRAGLRGGVRCPGIEQSEAVLEWLWDHQVPLLASDNIAVEAIPTSSDSPFYTDEERATGGGPTAGMFHHVAIPLLGMALGELWDVDALAADCAADGVWEFLLVAKPLNLVGGVGTPANAVAIK